MDEVLKQFTAMNIFPSAAFILDLPRFLASTNYDEKVKYALEYLSKQGKPVNINCEVKSSKKALECIERANKLFPSTPWQSLVEIYSEAVLYAPPDSSALARAYGNRSAVLCNGGLYKESILDINRALSIGYADDTKAKLYIRKAKCLLALDKKMSPEVKEAVDKARESLEKMDADNKNRFGDILDKLSSNMPERKPFCGIAYDKFLPQKIPEENVKIKRASSAIELKYSEKYGRHVVATRDIDAGETLVFQRSYASILYPNLLRKYCWQCSKQVWAGIACDQCVTVMYCNEFCRDEAWLEHHDIECLVIPKISSSTTAVFGQTVLRLTVRAYKEAGSLEKLKANLDKLDSITDPIAKCLTDGVYDDTKYASVYTLTRMNNIQFQHALISAMILYYLAAETDTLGERITSFHGLLKNRWAMFMGGLILKNYCIHLNNSIGILINDDKGIQLKRGGTLNPFISMFNHSCDPMICHNASGNMNAVVAFQKIKKGEQIFISYFPKAWEDVASVRRIFLLEKSEFLCECLPCVQGWGPWLVLPSRMAPRYPPAIEKELRRIRKKYGPIMMAHAAIEDVPAILSLTFSMINYYQHVVSYPTQQLIALKQLLFHLYSRVSF